MEEIKITGEFIKLDQLLKLMGTAGTGGHAKILIMEGEVKVNGEVATQRGKKIKPNDIVEVEGTTIKIVN